MEISDFPLYPSTVCNDLSCHDQCPLKSSVCLGFYWLLDFKTGSHKTTHTFRITTKCNVCVCLFGFKNKTHEKADLTEMRPLVQQPVSVFSKMIFTLNFKSLVRFLFFFYLKSLGWGSQSLVLSSLFVCLFVLVLILVYFMFEFAFTLRWFPWGDAVCLSVIRPVCTRPLSPPETASSSAFNSPTHAFPLSPLNCAAKRVWTSRKGN